MDGDDDDDDDEEEEKPKKSKPAPKKGATRREVPQLATESKNANNSDHNKRKYHRVFLKPIY
jgi:hypothetical protein